MGRERERERERKERGRRHSLKLFAFSPIIERSGYRNDQGVPRTGVQEGIRCGQVDRSLFTYETHSRCDRAAPSHHAIHYAASTATCFEVSGAFVS